MTNNNPYIFSHIIFYSRTCAYGSMAKWSQHVGLQYAKHITHTSGWLQLSPSRNLLDETRCPEITNSISSSRVTSRRKHCSGIHAVPRHHTRYLARWVEHRLGRAGLADTNDIIFACICLQTFPHLRPRKNALSCWRHHVSCSIPPRRVGCGRWVSRRSKCQDVLSASTMTNTQLADA